MTRRFNRLRKSSGQRIPTVHCLLVTRGVNRDVCEVPRSALRKPGEAPVRPEWIPRSRRRAGAARDGKLADFGNVSHAPIVLATRTYSTFRESPTRFVTPS